MEYGERLVTAKEYAQAVEFLVALDRDFPARVIEHKRGWERQRILRALGLSYSEMGKKQLALDTYRRLVDFDRRDFESRYLLAQACLKFGEPKLAEEHLAGVLKIHPTHMPSVRAYLKYHFDKGDFAAVIAAYETYLNAFLMRQITVGLGQSSANVYVPVDGRFHDLELRLTLLPEVSGELALRGEEFAIEIKQVTMQAPLLVGRARSFDHTRLAQGTLVADPRDGTRRDRSLPCAWPGRGLAAQHSSTTARGRRDSSQVAAIQAA